MTQRLRNSGMFCARIQQTNKTKSDNDRSQNIKSSYEVKIVRVSETT